MVNKIIVGILVSAMSAVLVVGAINRTNAKNEQAIADGPKQVNRGNSQVEIAEGEKDRSGQRESSEGNRHGQGRSGETQEDRDANSQGNAQASEWVSIEGVVMSIDDEVIAIQTLNRDEFILEGRPLRFALEQGFLPVIGEKLELIGFYEGTEFELGTIINLETNLEYSLREESGRPLWAGGRGKQGLS
jgi:hypothetical protein